MDLDTVLSITDLEYDRSKIPADKRVVTDEMIRYVKEQGGEVTRRELYTHMDGWAQSRN